MEELTPHDVPEHDFRGTQFPAHLEQMITQKVLNGDPEPLKAYAKKNKT